MGHGNRVDPKSTLPLKVDAHTRLPCSLVAMHNSSSSYKTHWQQCQAQHQSIQTWKCFALSVRSADKKRSKSIPPGLPLLAGCLHARSSLNNLTRIPSLPTSSLLRTTCTSGASQEKVETLLRGYTETCSDLFVGNS